MSRGHTKNPGFEGGNHWLVCDVCGFEYRHNVMKKRWDGLVVCPEDFELRHPQDFVRVKEEDVSAKGLVRPGTEDNFIEVACLDHSAIPGEAIPGCAVPGGYIEDDQIPESTF